MGGTVELVEEEESVVVDIAAVVEISWVCEGREGDILLILNNSFRRFLNRPQFLTFPLSRSHLILQNRTLALIHLPFYILSKLLVYLIGDLFFFLLFVALIFADQ